MRGRVYVGKCSYVGDNRIYSTISNVFDDIKKSRTNGNAIDEDVLTAPNRQNIEFFRRLGADNIDVEKFGKTVMVDASFSDNLSFGSLELNKLFEIVREGSDSFSITNGGDNDRGFSISYSFTFSEKVSDNG